MYKSLLTIMLVLVADSLCQRIIYPTWRPPPRRPVIIRTARSVSNDEPLWLYKGDDVIRAPASGDHPNLPSIIDDIKLDPDRRYARSVDSPSAKRSGGSHSPPSRNHDTGRTHPGYNRRNTRDVLPSFHLPNPYKPPLFRSLPGWSRPRTPIYASRKIIA
ncbi:lebocin-1/2-like [Danaus plexippus]|uniref:lebocin-1/2-like n=1 Tax=Danaus plexippus TaxID=13037 RepID=UPI002AAFE49F|nr:lebocin-1/2-like [Danaus plexippus]